MNWKESKKYPNPYKTPDDYFKKLNSRVMERIDLEQQARAKQRKRVWMISFATSVAAAIAIVMGGIGADLFNKSALQPNPASLGIDAIAADYSYYDEAYDYFMLDLNKIYNYETDEE